MSKPWKNRSVTQERNKHHSSATESALSHINKKKHKLWKSNRLKTNTISVSFITVWLGYCMYLYITPLLLVVNNNNDLKQSIVIKQEVYSRHSLFIGVKQRAYTNGSQSINEKQEAYNNGTQSIDAKKGTYTNSNQSILPKLQPHEGMSVCLIIKDENSNLPEWLAYHYIVGPLRYLVVSVDPSSKTSPMKILHKWNTTTDMDILVVDNYPRKFSSSPEEDSLNYYRWQHENGRSCIWHHWKNNRTWTLNIDVDEYIVFNPLKKTRITTKYTKLRKKLPEGLGSKTILQVIKEEKEKFPWAFKRCIFMPRVTFGDMEEQNVTILYEGVPEGFDPKKFNTLRFFRHDYLYLDAHFAYGKSLVDISRFKKEDMQNLQTHLEHVPFEECIDSRTKRNNGAPKLFESVFKMNHYSGTKTAFYKRGGFGKSSEDFFSAKFERMSKANRFVSYQTKSWLMSFVEQVGFAKAKNLLEGTGD